eukprot:1184627-Prorocentrum_minimum.AAC.1
MEFLLAALHTRAEKCLRTVSESGAKETERVTAEVTALTEAAAERLWAAQVGLTPPAIFVMFKILCSVGGADPSSEPAAFL